ncbi:dihydrodipicolinate synthase family protein [Kineosporia babensis]|uniref:Dihydrodipicolinate synthase family protein n=1 Tax=Kineosporia babensis TaxID=499548 RepID=A0A9X1NBN2_9ACTN|nr:dihydrodipicolinate synthase family protein [Kineosporia babensis]MCD5310744.1 dihydrodipicolinate synthase family protein [Kineosporia babensis]
MNRDDVTWSGYWPAAPTPFTADLELDEAALAAMLQMYAGQGVHGVLLNGSTGEWFAQSPAERRRVTEVGVEAVAGRYPVVIGVSAFTAAEAAELARHAAAAGADGVLATVPPYAHPSPAETLAFYREVSEATDLPFMVYNWPRGVAVDLAQTPGLMSQLADLPQVAAIKDSTGDWNAMVATIEAVAERVRVFGSLSHRRGLALMTGGLGGDGAIDGGGIGAPYAVPFFEAAQAGDLKTARTWVERYQKLSAGMIAPDYSGRFASPISQLKAAMNLLGQPGGGAVRPPLLPVTDPELLQQITAVLTEAGFTPLAQEA